MVSMFSGGGLWHLVGQADLMTKMVLLLLLGMSVVCWAVFIGKYMLFAVKKRQLDRAIKRLRDVQVVSEMRTVATQFSNTVPGYILSRSVRWLQLRNGEQGLAYHDIKLFQQEADQIIDTVIAHEESYVPILSVSASVAPLLGLFGTVWGLVHAFMSISEKQSADIATVAPGIAEALITTLAGLMVAIPALIMANILYAQIRSLEQKVITLTQQVGTVVQQLMRG